MRPAGPLALLLVLAIGASAGEREPAAAVPVSVARDSAAIIASARASADLFVASWRYYWEVSERYRHIFTSPYLRPIALREKPVWDPPIVGLPKAVLEPADSLAALTRWVESVVPSGEDWPGFDLSRALLLHCHPEQKDTLNRLGGILIPSSTGKRAVCASWYRGETAPPWNERIGLDSAILSQFRPIISGARTRLLGELTQAAAALPGDGWLTGQRVRFALDQGDILSAARATAACGAAPWWCTALTGYLASVRNDMARADSIFGVMLSQMPANERCAWTDLSVLLEPADRKTYAKTPCQRRDSLNTTIWWLSDPLYVEPGNERRAEHYARRVLVALRSGTEMSERWDMRPKGGGAAVSEMLLRYGWPTFSYWEGRSQDADHYAYLDVTAAATWDHGRFATAEYATPRFHTVPSWQAITQPTRAQPTDWMLSYGAFRTGASDAAPWLPAEHYDRSTGALVQLDAQAGLFRRQDSVLLAVATNLWADDVAGAEGDTIRGSLVFSTGATDRPRFAPAAGTLGYTAVLRSSVASQPQVVSVEMRGQGDGIMARARFGIEPPPPLSAMRPGEVAISAPVLVQPLETDDLPPTDPATALARMYGSTRYTFTGPGRALGVYWETYGVADRDTVDIAIRVERREPARGGSRNAVGFTWREPDPGRRVLTIATPVPIQGRNVSLDISSLVPGDYSVTVSVARPRGRPVTASRDFRLTP